MAYVDEHCSAYLKPHMVEAITAAFLDVSATLTGAVRTTAPAERESGITTWISNRLPDLDADQKPTYASQIEVAFTNFAQSALGVSLEPKEIVWSSVWPGVLLLANDETWKKNIRAVRAKYLDAGIERALKTTEFGALETQLSDRVPHLSLTQSGIERLRFEITGELKPRKYDKLVGKLVPAATITTVSAGLGVLAHIDVGANLFTSVAVGGAYLVSKAPSVLDLDLSSKGGLLSKKMTPLSTLAPLLSGGG